MIVRLISRLLLPILLILVLFLITGESMQLLWVIILVFMLAILATVPYVYSLFSKNKPVPMQSEARTKEDIIKQKNNAAKLLLEPLHNPPMVRWWNAQPFDLKKEYIEMYYNRQDEKNMWWESLPISVKKSFALKQAKSDHIDISQKDIQAIYQANASNEAYQVYLDEMSIRFWWDNNSFLRKEQMILLANKLSAMASFLD